MVKNSPAGDVGSVLSLDYPLEKEMANHSGILAWKIPLTKELGRLYVVHGVTKESDKT